MIGILVEKPSAARNFAAALGGMSGSYHGESYRIVAARGHLYEFRSPDEQVSASLKAQYKSWDLSLLPWNERDFAWEKSPKKGTGDTIRAIKEGLKGCDEITIATDCDPTGEGELLAWEILDAIRVKPKRFSRMYFLDESAVSVQKAFVNRKALSSMQQDMDYVKADYRSKYDFLTMQFTRIATGCGDGRSVLRQGRLKSAMVRLVGDQLDAVKAYKKIPFYQRKFRDENGVVYTDPKEPTFPTKEEVTIPYHPSAVVCDSRVMKKTVPPKYLDLAGLSSRLASKGYKAKTVLDVYQKMYESQIVSYPRTEDSFVSPEQFKDMLPHIDAIARVVGVDASVLTHRTLRSTHVKTGGAHGANRPGPKVPSSLSALTSFGDCAPAIYELVARSYLASLAEDYEYEEQKGHVMDYPSFTGKVNVPKKQGWKAVIRDSDGSGDEGAGLGRMASPFVAEGFPPRPQAPTMAWLMQQLEKHDVGTGATRTSIYAEVTDSKAKYPLLLETRGKLSMTEYGEMSHKLLPDTHIGDVAMTEELQNDMRQIAAGKADPNTLLSRMKTYVMDDLAVMSRNGQNMRKDMGKTMMTNEKEYVEGTWNGEPVRFNRVWSGHRFTDEECEQLLDGEEIVLKDLNGKNGPYSCKGRLEQQVYNGHEFVGFSRTGFVDDGTPRVPSKFCGHVFTATEKKLLEKGETLELTGLIGKSGKPFDCKVVYGKKKDGRMGIAPSFSDDFEYILTSQKLQ